MATGYGDLELGLESKPYKSYTVFESILSGTCNRQTAYTYMVMLSRDVSTKIVKFLAPGARTELYGSNNEKVICFKKILLTPENQTTKLSTW